MQEGDRRGLGIVDTEFARLAPLPGEDPLQQDAQHLGPQRRIPGGHDPQREGQREHPLSVANDGHVRPAGHRAI